MRRIVYLGFPGDKITGGQKMIFRHVETLCDLGYASCFWTNASCKMPTWFSHSAPIEIGTKFRDDDILVVPEDAPNAIAAVASMPHQFFLFCQNHFSLAAIGFEALETNPGRLGGFLASSEVAALAIRRGFPGTSVDVVPCFVDELVFRPGTNRIASVAFAPAKKPLEANSIKGFFKRFHPEYADLLWHRLQGLSEDSVADALGYSSLFLSLAHLESPGMAALEAMSCGSLVAGFTGVGGRDYATPDNGFWADENDCEAAADCLALAAGVAQEAGPAYRRRIEAGRETARSWSRGRFQAALETFWARRV